MRRGEGVEVGGESWFELGFAEEVRATESNSNSRRDGIDLVWETCCVTSRFDLTCSALPCKALHRLFCYCTIGGSLHNSYSVRRPVSVDLNIVIKS